MRKIFSKKLLAISCALVYVFTCIGQANNPVKVETQIVPPITPYVLDYVNGNIQKLYVNLLLTTDALTPTLDVKLHLTIESNSNNVRIETTNDPILYDKIKTISLERNVLQIIDVSDLREYFEIKNLVFTGTTAQDFVNTNGQLADGVYKICFDAYARRGNAWVNVTNALSAFTGCKDLFMSYNDPPMLNLPEQGATIASLSHNAPQAQNIIFNWVPRHPAALSAVYSLEIFEIPPAYNGDPNVIVQASTPRFTKTIYGTTFDFNTVVSDGFLMLPNRDYAYRVKVQSADGGDPYASLAGNNLFKNNGYSEVRLFHVEGPCTLPEDIDVDVKGEDVAIINYKPVSSNSNKKYTVRYRKLGTAFWEEEKVDDATGITLAGLKKLTTYEYMLSGPGGTCFNSAEKFTTSDKPSNQFVNCGEIDAVNDLETSNLPSLLQNGSFKAGSFTVVATTVSGINGVFSGTGHIAVPLFYNAGVKVNFTNVHINAKGEMNQGVVETSIGEMNTLYDFTNLDDNFTFIDADALGGTITNASNIVVGTNTITVTIKNPDGTNSIKTFPYTPGAGAQIKDKDGNVYTIDKDGNVSGPVKENTNTGNGVNNNNTANNNGNATTSTAGSGPSLNTKRGQLIFFPSTNMKYGFDNTATNADKVTDANGGEQKVYWKSTGVNEENETVTAKIENIASVLIDSLDKIIFISNGIKLNATQGTGIRKKEWDITLPKQNTVSILPLFGAYVPKAGDTTWMGKLNVVSYKPLEKTVVFVPLNDLHKGIIETALKPENQTNTNAQFFVNRQYTQANVKINMEQSNVLLNGNDNKLVRNILKDRKIALKEKEVTCEYSTEMKELIDSLKTKLGNAYDPNKYYLFTGSASEIESTTTNLLGAFPLPNNEANMGFVFLAATNRLRSVTMHEIGHGIFHLGHDNDGDINAMQKPFDHEKLNYFFSKKQWDAMHEDGRVIPKEEVDGDCGAVPINNLVNKFNGFENSTTTDAKDCYTFRSPSGMPITLPKSKISKVSFIFDDDEEVIGELLTTSKGLPEGSLMAFVRDGVVYKAKIVNVNGSFSLFLGYYKYNPDKKVFIDNNAYEDGLSKLLYEHTKYNKIEKIKVIIGLGCLEANRKFKLKIYVPNVPIGFLEFANNREYKAVGIGNKLQTDIIEQFKQYLPKNNQSLLVGREILIADFKSNFTKTAKDFLQKVGSCDGKDLTAILNVANLIDRFPEHYKMFALYYKQYDIYTGITSEAQYYEKFNEAFIRFISYEFNPMKWPERIVPEIFWKNETTAPVYAQAFVAGIIDGLYSDIKFIAKDMNDFTAAWNPLEQRYYTIKSEKVRKSTAEVVVMLIRLYHCDNLFTPLHEQVVKQFIAKKLLNADCEELQQLEISMLNAIMNSGVEALKNTITLEQSPQVRYNQGKAFYIAASFIFGVGEIKAIITGEKTILTVLKESVKIIPNTFKSAIASIKKYGASLKTKIINSKTVIEVFNREGKSIGFLNKAGYLKPNKVDRPSKPPVTKTIYNDYPLEINGENKIIDVEVIKNDKGEIGLHPVATKFGQRFPNIYKNSTFIDMLNNSKVVDEIANKYPNIAKEYITIIQLYNNGNNVDNLNAALRGINPITDYLTEYKSFLNEGLDLLPKIPSNQKMYRVVKYDDNLLSQFQEGKIFEEKGFTAAVSSEAAREKLLYDGYRPGGHNVVFIINGQNGRKLRNIAPGGIADEIVFASPTKFRVTKRSTRDPLPNEKVSTGLAKVTIIEMEEVVDDLPSAGNKIMEDVAFIDGNIVSKINTLISGNKASQSFWSNVKSINNSKPWISANEISGVGIKFYNKENDAIALITSDGKLKTYKTNTSGFKPSGEKISSTNAGEVIIAKADGVEIRSNEAGEVFPILVKENGDKKSFCIGEGSKCFIAGTKVSIKDGFKNIEDIKVGDSVYAYNEQNKKSSLQKVIDTFKKTTSSLVKIFVGKDIIQSTPEHPFYTTNGWMNAVKLSKGIKVLTLAGSMLAIDSVFAEDTVAAVYNFEVENFHNYYIGSHKILVHNICAISWVDNNLNINNGFDDVLIRALKADIKNVKNSYFKNLLENASSDAEVLSFIKAWKLVREAIPTIDKLTTQFALDPYVIKQIAIMSKDGSDFRKTIGNNWQQDLIDVIKTAKKSPCETCGASGNYNSFLPMDGLLKCLNYFILNFSVIDWNDGNKFYNWIKGKTFRGTSPTEFQLYEVHQTLEVLSRDKLKGKDIEGLGGNFPIGGKQYDIKRSDGKYHELKNKALANITNGILSKSDFEQLIEGYLMNINSLDQLIWEARFDKLREKWETPTIAKEKIRLLIRNSLINRNQYVFETLKLEKIQELFGGSIGSLADFEKYLRNRANENYYLRFIKILE